jgi:hypothetical protein
MHRHYNELTISVFKMKVFWIRCCIFQPAAPYTAKDHRVSIFKAKQFKMNSPPPKKSVLYRHDQCRYPMEKEGVNPIRVLVGWTTLQENVKMESIHQTVCHIPEDLRLQQYCCKNHIVNISISSFSDFIHSFLAASPSFLTNFLFVSHTFIPFCTIN